MTRSEDRDFAQLNLMIVTLDRVIDELKVVVDQLIACRNGPNLDCRTNEERHRAQEAEMARQEDRRKDRPW